MILHFSSQGLSAEKDNLDIVQHEWILPKFEHRAEAVLRKIVSWSVSGSQVLYISYGYYDLGTFFFWDCCEK